MNQRVPAILLAVLLALAAISFASYVKTGLNSDISVGFVLLVVGLLTSNYYRLRGPLDRRLSS